MLSNLLLNSAVEWSRAQFALTAIYHWFFVPLTLGLSFMIAIMETIYVKTGNEFWKKTVKFWMTVFGVNFAIGVATGLILEFEFGTNWSNYSWFVGDIFGAPLAIEGILAFFMESTFIAIMFFGWNKVSKKAHLVSSWLVAFGANISAIWILIANAWMQYPVGMKFNPDTARNEMNNFWDVLFSPVGVSKFFHTVTSSYVLAAIVVIAISAWFLLKGREIMFAKKSIIIASVFGILSSVAVIWTGDTSSYEVAQKQPMKLAAMEGLYNGEKGAGLNVIGNIEIPKLLSIMGYNSVDAFVPGVNDIINGYEYNDGKGKVYKEPSIEEKMIRGKAAIAALAEYKNAKEAGDEATASAANTRLEADFKYFGYGFLNDPSDVIPNIPLCYYSFRIMVGLGILFLLIFVVALFKVMRSKNNPPKWMLYIAIISAPLAYVASQCGWLVAEMGRQPWTIQDLLPTVAAVSRVDAGAIMVTFFLFLVLFTILMIAELRIMFSQIRKGPNIDTEN